jgi:hypothetical protein
MSRSVWPAAHFAALRTSLVVTAVSLGAQGAPAPDVKITIDHNPVAASTREFKFTRVASPLKEDAATKAELRLVDGAIDANSAPLAAVVDGFWPREEDEPAANVFFNAGTGGGRFRMDLGSAIDVAEVRSYSWHPNTRGPQVYTLYASDGTMPGFNPAPRSEVDPATVGWTLIANVDTRVPGADPGGQYAVSIRRATGSLGKYRHLLFLCAATELDDNWGNTFYSEIDVVAAPGYFPTWTSIR